MKTAHPGRGEPRSRPTPGSGGRPATRRSIVLWSALALLGGCNALSSPNPVGVLKLFVFDSETGRPIGGATISQPGIFLGGNPAGPLPPVLTGADGWATDGRYPERVLITWSKQANSWKIHPVSQFEVEVTAKGYRGVKGMLGQFDSAVEAGFDDRKSSAVVRIPLKRDEAAATRSVRPSPAKVDERKPRP